MSDSAVKKVLMLKDAKDAGNKVLLTFKNDKQLKPYPYVKTISTRSVEVSWSKSK